MRQGIVVDVTAADRVRLEAVVANRNSPQKHVWRARIILLTADGLGTSAVMRVTGRAKSVIWRWQERFMQEGVDGLLHDKTRPPGRKPLDGAIIEQVVSMTAEEPPGETTHWTAGLMAKAVGISVSSVQRIWQAHGLQPHRVRRFKLSKDPEFVPAPTPPGSRSASTGVGHLRPVANTNTTRRFPPAAQHRAGNARLVTMLDRTAPSFGRRRQRDAVPYLQ